MVYRIDNGKYRIKIALKNIQRRKTFFGTRIEAEHEEERWKTELLRKRDGVKAPIYTVTDLVDYFLDNHAKYKKPSTYHGSKVTLYRFKKDFGQLDPRSITKEMMTVYFNGLMNLRHKPEEQIKLSDAAKYKYMVIVKQTFDYAIKNERIAENPLKWIPLPKLTNTRDRILNSDEWRALYSELREHQKPITLFAYQVPCRVSELVSMKRDQVDVEHGIVYLHDGTTKNNLGRIMPIPENLKEYFKSIPADSEYAFYRTIEDKETHTKQYLPLGDLKNSFNKAKKRAGVPWLHFHDLRHCAVSQMASNGIRQEVIMKVAGMKTPSIFHRYRTINLKEITDSVSFYKDLSLDKPKENPDVS